MSLKKIQNQQKQTYYIHRSLDFTDEKEINTNIRIRLLNDWLHSLAIRKDFVTPVLAAPNDLKFYRWDKSRKCHDIHLNVSGKRVLVNELVKSIQNFQRVTSLAH